MALQGEQLRNLAKLMVEEMHPDKTEVLLVTGEQFSDGELDIARAFRRATPLQRSAIRAVIASWELSE